MNKKLFVLLPAAMMVLTACGGGNTSSSSSSTGSSTGTSTGSSTGSSSDTSSTGPVVKSSLQIAYEAAAALPNTGEESSEAYTFTGVITGTQGNTFFVQDGDYGMMVYGGKTSYATAEDVGKNVEVVAKVKNYNGCYETGTITSAVPGDVGTLPEPAEILTKDDLVNLKQNVLVDAYSLVAETDYNWADLNFDYKMSPELFGEEVTVFGSKYLKNQDLVDEINAVGFGQEFDIYNAVTAVNYDNPQICLIAESEVYSEPRTLMSISVKTAPTKVNYAVGDSFNAAGLVITALYDDDYEEDVPYVGHESEFSFAPSSNLQESDVKVVITWGGKSVDQAITVEDVEATEVVCKSSASSVQVDGTVTLSAEYNGTHTGTTTFEVVASGTTGDALIDGDTLTGVAEGDVYVKAVSSAPALESEPIKIEVVPAKSSMQVAYEAAAALGKGKTSSEEYTFTGVVTGTKKSQDDISSYTDFFVQDGEYGMYVYKVANTDVPANLQVGKTVSVTAKVKNYNGCLETGSAPTIVVDGDGILPTPVTVTSKAELGALKQNVLVNFTYAMPATLGTWSTSSYARLSGKLGSDTVTLTLEKGVWSEEKAAVYANAGGKNVVFTSGISTAFDSSAGNPTANQLFLSEQSTMAIDTTPATELVCTTDKSSINVGETATLGHTENGSLAAEVTYSITEGSEFASLSGNVLTGSAEGTVKVKASCSDPALQSAEISITVNPAAEAAYSLPCAKEEYGTPAGNGDYASFKERTVNGVTWQIQANLTVNNWGFGGKFNESFTKALYSQTAIAGNIARVEIDFGATCSLTVDKIVISVYDTAEAAAAGTGEIASIEGAFPGTSKTGSYSKADSTSWAGKFFRITFNLTSTTTSSNKRVDITEVRFYE